MASIPNPDPAQMQQLAAQYPETPCIEIVTTITAYNMASRFLEALQVHTGDQPELTHAPA